VFEGALLLVGLVSSGAVAEPVAFGGSTVQERPVVVRLADDRAAVTRFTVVWQAKCENGGRVAFTSDLARPPIRVSSGRFRNGGDTIAAEGGERVEIEHRLAGSVDSSGVDGVLRFTATYVDATGAETNTCASGRLRFRTRSARIGESSQHEPVWIGARGLGFGWTARCASGEAFFVAEVANGVRIHRVGRRFRLRLVGWISARRWL